MIRRASIPHTPVVIAVSVLSLLAVTACTGTPDVSVGAGATSASTARGGDVLTVLAAASLTDVFEQIATDFEADHDGVDVQFSFAASSAIVAQVNEGAPADVIALAGQGSLEPLEREHRKSEPVVFTTNSLQIAVPPDNPANISDLADLVGTDLILVVCEQEVPCGSAAQKLWEKNSLTPTIASYEKDVRATLTKVELGEADAGLVYRTDITEAGSRVLGIEIPAEQNVINSYPILTVSEAALAQAFVEEVLSERGQAHLGDAGFVSP